MPLSRRASGRHAGIEHPIRVMRADHDDHAAEHRAYPFADGRRLRPTMPCGSWRALYLGTKKLFADLSAHIALENDVLFPRFEGGHRNGHCDCHR